MDGIYRRQGAEARKGIKAAVFDFDGTISTLRCGWESVMRRMMLSALPPESCGKMARLVDRYIDESTGVQTIYQMEWLAGIVAGLTGAPEPDPWEYKEQYNALLMEEVDLRKRDLARGGDTAEYLVPGSLWFLQYLRDAGVKIYVASGTDDADLQTEVELLGVSPYICCAKGSPYRQKGCSKEWVIRQILTSEGISGDELLVVGDGKVEIALGRQAGGVTLGVASDEANLSGSYNNKKFEKLRNAQADFIIPDYLAIKAALGDK